MSGEGGPVIRTLIVDDDYRVASIHTAYVARVPGFSVVGQSHTASAAVEQVDALRPDLVLMDVYLPDTDGLSAIRRIMERPVHPDFMVITAARDVNTVRSAMQLGAVHYLIKPFGFDVFSERLTSYRKVRQRLADLGDAGQAEVDALYGLLHAPPPTAQLAKGHSAPTLELVRNAVQAAAGDVSASEIAEVIGVSRATAQRYLTYLVKHGVITLQLRYGAAGRPEHRYTMA